MGVDWFELMADFLLPIWLIVVMTGAALIALLTMLHYGHDRVLILILISVAWHGMAFLLSALNLIDDEARITLLRAGFASLDLALVVNGIVYAVKHRAQHGRRS